MVQLMPVHSLRRSVTSDMRRLRKTLTYLMPVASIKSRLVIPFLYQFTRVVPDKGPLNGCVCVFLIYFSLLFLNNCLKKR